MKLLRDLSRRYPNKTFQGRERVSLAPRWLNNWVTTLTILYVMGSYISTFLGYENPLSRFIGGSGDASAQMPTPTYVIVPEVPINTPMNFHADTGLATGTPYPTYTPYPTHTQSADWLQGTATVTQNSFQPQDVNWVFSYYYPDLVGVDEVLYGANCHPDNIERNKQGRAISCKNTSASGLGWRDWLMYDALDPRYQGGVAVPYYPNTYSPIYPMGTVIIITSPSIIAGQYLVMDICPACDDYVQTHDVLFLDFLAKGLPDGVTFWNEVQIQEVIYP